MQPLAALEATLPDILVRGVYLFEVEGVPATDGGVTVRPLRGQQITAPLPRQNKAAVDTEEEFGSDCSGGVDNDDHQDSDIEKDDIAVFTGSEDGGTSSGSSSSDELNELAKPATGGISVADLTKLATPASDRTASATSVKRTVGRSREYDNGYFKLGYRSDHPGVLAKIHESWLMDGPEGLGRIYPASRTITASKVGDDLHNPVRSFLCLRAWMLWRARQDDWVAAHISRQRLFTDEAERLLLDIKRLQPQADGFMGNPNANKMVKMWAPDVVARLFP